MVSKITRGWISFLYLFQLNNIMQQIEFRSRLWIHLSFFYFNWSISSVQLLSHVWLFVTPWTSPGQNTVVGSFSLLQRIFPNQGSNPGLLNYRRILYQLSHRGSPRILEWVAYPFSSGSFWRMNRTGVSCITGWFFSNWAIREALPYSLLHKKHEISFDFHYQSNSYFYKLIL